VSASPDRRFAPYRSVDRLLKDSLRDAGADGLPTYELVDLVTAELPLVARQMQRKLMADFIRRRVGRLKDEAGLPWARSVSQRYVQRSFWSPDDYRQVIEGYTRRGRSNLAVAERLAQEAKAVHDIVIHVPTLFDYREAS
jgi:hypothetical protein